MSKFKKKECMHALVQSGTIPGILGYLRSQPIAWCSIGPREQYPSLERSSVLKRIDGERVWSMVCLYVSRYARGKGLVHELIKGALDYAKSQGATVVEAYPAVPQPTARVTMTFMGLPPMFRKAGFVEVAQPSKYRKIMRRDLIPARSSQASRRRISAAARTR